MQKQKMWSGEYSTTFISMESRTVKTKSIKGLGYEA